MLEALRRSTSGWIVKILLFLLIFSFAIWGVGDMLVGFGGGSVAKVGEQQVSVEEFQRAQQNALMNLSEQAGRRVTAEEARAAGIDRQVLRGVIGQKALKHQAESLDLALSNETLVEEIQNDEAFEGPDGKFSRLGFDGFLRQVGLSEAGYVAIRRDDELRQQITSALQNAVTVPPAMIEAQHAFNKEERVIKHVKIDVDLKIDVPEPDDAKLKEVYDANKSAFMTPEYRKFNAIMMSLDDIKKKIEIPEDDVKRAYEDTKDQYDKAERRNIQQIVFKTKEEAEAARKEIDEKGFLQVAEARGLKESDISLGMKTKSQLFDSKIAEAAFSIERDKLSEIIDGTFGPVLLRVIEIEAGEQSTFEGVKDKVLDRLKTERARLEIQEAYDLVEEARNAGKTLKEAADELKLTYLEVEGGSKDNKTADDKTAVDQPDADELLTAVFAAEPGYDNEAAQLTKSEGYAWYNVLSIEAPKQKEFDAIKDEVKTFHVNQETERLTKELADKLVERLNAGEDFAAVAKDAGGEVETTDPPINRKIQPPGLTKEAVELAFSLAGGSAASTDSPDRSSRTVLKVTEIKPAPEMTEEDKSALTLELRQKLREDLLTTYIAALEDRVGVTVNDAEFRRITGADLQQ
jgi:peptidyl-prolyl cis-trans isomerase D